MATLHERKHYGEAIMQTPSGRIMSAAVEATPRKLVMAALVPRARSGLRPHRRET
ncbi:hypothetical protein ACFW08_37665 [Streptomyces sp. NPDC058960]|uniref:hypothetical protein n=1 Tax=Streptomyces sp. NPDC058960 TaxID=3346679 RepID=UPI003697D4D8